QDRLDAVEELAFRTLEREALREALQQVQDVERLLGRATLGSAGPRELLALARSIHAAPRAQTALQELLAPLLRRQLKDLDPPLAVADEVLAQLVDDAPATLKDGGAIRDGVDQALDELRQISRGGKSTIAAIEE